jgi:Zn-dependent protease with chaperone function
MALCVLTCIRWRQGTSNSGDKAQGSLVDASAASPTGMFLGQPFLILILGGDCGPVRIHCRAVYLALVLLLLAGSIAAFGSKKAPKLAETIDLPLTFESDFQSAAKQRAQLGSQREVPENIAGRVGEDVFESLVKNEMISDFRLPYTWTVRSYDSPDVNAFSLADGEVVAFAGLSRLIGTNRGLWAAVLAHEIAQVARRHAVRKALC